MSSYWVHLSGYDFDSAEVECLTAWGERVRIHFKSGFFIDVNRRLEEVRQLLGIAVH